MRATNLLPSLLNERHSLRRRRRRAAVDPGVLQAAAPQNVAPAGKPAPAQSRASASQTPFNTPDQPSYVTVQRARSAGGPIDNACYSCPCGLVFAAPVSTTVCCPRCGAPQAW
jgi:hypothetical protein